MRGRGADAAGFSLVEVVIAMFIFGLIAIALLPPLINGLRFSSEQALTATATRQLNALIEQARERPKCADINLLAPATFERFTVGDGGYVCTPGSVNTLTLTARDAAGEVLATATAKVLVDS
ncbi:type IV pilus modification PilV family protein [Microbacterium sp. Leaf288]|uniref:type IV pilus modification PilV family protein n=1 Tax=Microbacterium sp. Leaf288 TaxID=1736323 RepID=UPI0009E6E36E|nr:prepilin-type N-terminal cleavage/methylation domain-containing protein [Microbacterium sp. Leaf288]